MVRDDLITGKGLKVKCSRCGTTFLIRKRLVKSFEGARDREREEEPKLNPEALLELTKEYSFKEQLLSASFALKLLFFASVAAIVALVSFSVMRYLKVREMERAIYADVALRHGYISDAIAELEKLVKEHPDNLSYNFVLAEAYRVLGDERAKDFYLKCAELVDDDGVKGSLLVRAGRLSEGISLLEGYLLMAQDAAAVSNDLGIAYLEAGRRDKGLSLLKDASASYPYESLFNRVVYGLKSGVKGLSSLVESLYSSYPTRVEVLVNTAYFYIKAKNYPKALQLLMMAKGDHPWSALVEHDIGVVYRLMGDERYRAYMARDVIKDDKPRMVDYLFLLNPEVEVGL